MTEPTTELRDRLIAAQLLYPTGVDGLYGRSATFERVVDGLGALVHRWGVGRGATEIHLPPVLDRRTFDASGYMRSFPDLAGSVHVFRGGDAEHAELIRHSDADGDWGALLGPAEIVLAPAACHGLYPMCTGRLPEGGRVFEVRAFCFRHEPSPDPTRLQAFRMHELVVVGEPASALRHRDEGLSIGLGILDELGLDPVAAPANDPFFGRLGRALAAGQRDEGLKSEGLVRVEGATLAVMSANYHREHFGAAFGIETPSGEVAHSACVGFGCDRLAVALFARHGTDPDQWPAGVRKALFR